MRKRTVELNKPPHGINARDVHGAGAIAAAGAFDNRTQKGSRVTFHTE